MTAVEYLIEQLFELSNPTLNQIKIIEKAKEIEKRQCGYSEKDMRKMYDKSCGKIGLGELNDQTENDNRFKEFLEQLKN